MHVIRDKKTKKVLFIDYSMSKKPQKAKAVYPEFNASKMELGWTDTQHIPADFDIDGKGNIVPISLETLIKNGTVKPAPDQKVVNGEIVGKTIEELVADGLFSIDELKKIYVERYSHEAFTLRQSLIPDYKIQNAALGLYDEKTAETFKNTINEFRNEFYRLKNAVENADSVQTLEAIKPDFPTAIVS